MNEKAIQNLYEEWESLEMDLLQPCKLTKAQCKAIVRARRDLKDPTYLKQIPFRVASFKENAAAEICAWAKRQTKDYSTNDPAIELIKDFPDYVYNLAQRFENDASKMTQALFGKGKAVGVICHIGLFSKPRTPELHMDSSVEEYTPLYLARLGSLPIEIINPRHQKVVMDTIHNTLRALKKRKTWRSTDYLLPDPFTKMMREEGYLVPIPLNDVYLAMTTEQGSIEFGTPHCSSPMPDSSTHSAFFNARTCRFH